MRSKSRQALWIKVRHRFNLFIIHHCPTDIRKPTNDTPEKKAARVWRVFIESQMWFIAFVQQLFAN